MSLAKEKDLLKTNLSFLPACKTGNFPHLLSTVPGKRPGIFSKLLFLLCRESCLFPCPTRTMIGLETVLRSSATVLTAFKNSQDSFRDLITPYFLLAETSASGLKQLKGRIPSAGTPVNKGFAEWLQHLKDFSAQSQGGYSG